MIPGSNLLNMAHLAIAQQRGTLERLGPRTQNRIGQYVNTYEAPVPITGSFQPVPRSVYEQLGLDFNKFYMMLYTSIAIDDVQKNESGDIVNFNSQRFRVESRNEWTPIDGWNGVLMIRVNADE